MAEKEAETYDATDTVAENNLRRDEKRRARQDADVLRKLMHDAPGRAWLYRKLESCHIYSSTFSPGQPDITAFQLGEENVGKKLMLEAQLASVDLYMKMIKEQQEEVRRQDEERIKESNRREEAETPPAEFMPELPPPYKPAKKR